jgi:hypothetical protein
MLARGAQAAPPSVSPLPIPFDGSAHLEISGSLNGSYDFVLGQPTSESSNYVFLQFGEERRGMALRFDVANGATSWGFLALNLSGVTAPEAEAAGSGSPAWVAFHEGYYTDGTQTQCAVDPASSKPTDLHGSLLCSSLRNAANTQLIHVVATFVTRPAGASVASPSPESSPTPSVSVALPRTDGVVAGKAPASGSVPVVPLVIGAGVIGLGIAGLLLRTALRPAPSAVLDLARSPSQSRDRRRERTRGGHARCQARWAAGQLSVSDARTVAARDLRGPLDELTGGWNRALGELDAAESAFGLLTAGPKAPRRSTVAARREETLRRILVQALDASGGDLR